MGALCSSEPEQPPNPVSVDLTHFTLLKVVGKGGFGKVNAIQRKQGGELMALKRMGKAEVCKKESHIRMVWTERDIMSRLNSPFLVNLVHAFQDDRELYLVMPFQQGGDLRYHLGKLGCLSEIDARFYMCEIILGLEAMHSINVVYRDLKPDNLLLDSDGHLRLSDFGLSVELKEKNDFRIRGNAGTSGYLAPEVCTGEPYGLSCDIFSLGVTAYEMIHGRRPFKQWKPTDTIDPVSTLRFGSNVSQPCQDFIRGLLTINPTKRLGCSSSNGKDGWKEIKSHVWFQDIHWDMIKSRSLTPPIIPDTEQANCNNSADLADQLMDKEPESITAEQQKNFINFEHNVNYQEYLASIERDNNLAGLNMSQATDIGPIGSHATNPSHMNSHNIDPPPSQRSGNEKRASGNAVAPAPAPTTVAGSSTLTVPQTCELPSASASASSTSTAQAASEKYVVPDNKADNATTAATTTTNATTSTTPRKQPTSSRNKSNDMAFTRHHVQALETTTT